MKKFISLLLIVLMFSLMLCSCGKSDETKAAEAKIDAIGSIDLSKAAAIEEAEKAYAFLMGEDKEDVKNYDELKEKRASYDKLKEYSDKADALLKLYDRIFSEYGIAYSEVNDAFGELSTALSEVSGDIKNEYDKIFAPVSEKNDEYKAVCEAAVKSAASYVNSFKKINEIGTFELKNIGCIAQISDGTTYYLFAMTYSDGSGTDKSVYSSARFAGTPTIESMMAYKDNFYSEKPLSEKTNALECSNILLDVNDILGAL